jgi:hypothetical protein
MRRVIDIGFESFDLSCDPRGVQACRVCEPSERCRRGESVVLERGLQVRRSSASA